MALTATMRRFEVTLADSDRGVYDTLDLRVAQHPSESERYLVARLVARALEHAEGVSWSKGGLSADDEPALWQRDLRGDLQAWIEVGSPSPERLHKAKKAVPRVVVYGWSRVDALAAALVEEKVYKGDAIELYALDAAVLDAVAATLERTNTWEIAVTGGTVYLSTGARSFELPVVRVHAS
ncbi:MAG: YaeQ family protein [Deltaproteobacteria bacterium]|nr:YaeQ family protein [Kofleriaceae bacterium]